MPLEVGSSSTFFPFDKQRLPPKIRQETDDKNKIMLSGIKMNVVSVGKIPQVQIKPVVEYANKDYRQMTPRRNDVRVRLLQETHSSTGTYHTIAGVRIDDVTQPITDRARRTAIKKAIEILKVDAEYWYRDDAGKGQYFVSQTLGLINLPNPFCLILRTQPIPREIKAVQKQVGGE